MQCSDMLIFVFAISNLFAIHTKLDKIPGDEIDLCYGEGYIVVHRIGVVIIYVYADVRDGSPEEMGGTYKNFVH